MNTRMPTKPPMSTTLIFAYGSNLAPAQLLHRCPGARFYARARVEGVRLTFAGRSVRWQDGGVAGLEVARKSYVDGVLFRLDAFDLTMMDYYEGHPTSYQRSKCHARTETDLLVRAETYVLLRGIEEPRLPSAEYLATIRRGYEAWSMPKAHLHRAVQRVARVTSRTSRDTGNDEA